MFRRLFVAAMVVAMALSGCGRQVTGLGTPGGNGLTPGNMLIRFRTQGPQDFNQFQYVIVFNTSGNGQEPFANAYITGFQNYTFALVVGAGGGNGVNPVLVQYYPVPGTSAGVATRQIPIPTGLLQFLPNSNGRNTEFQITFNRTLLNVPFPTGTSTPTPSATTASTTTPLPGTTGTPGPGGIPPTATPIPTGSAAPTAAPTANGSATPAPAPTATATVPPSGPTITTVFGNPWNLNFVVTDNGNRPIDAFGATGINDTSFSYTVDVTTKQDNTLTRPLGTLPSGGAAATITGAEIINAP